MKNGREYRSSEIRKVEDLNRLMHDLKLPLTVVQSISDIMFKLNEQEELENYIFMLHSNIKYLSRLTKDIQKTINEIDDDSDESYLTDIFGYTEMLVESVQAVCEIKGIKIEYDNQEQFLEVLLNWRCFERIILNVIQNSIKHALDCTEITVLIEFDSNRIKVHIADNGKVKKSKNKENTKSSGQGLFIITSLAKKMNSEVKQNFTESGMRFLLEIPLIEGEMLSKAIADNSTQLNIDLA